MLDIKKADEKFNEILNSFTEEKLELYLKPKGENNLPLHPIANVEECMKSYEKVIMKEITLEELYINEALNYKREKDACKWWQFKKKAELDKKRKTSLEIAMMYGTNFPNRKVYVK